MLSRIPALVLALALLAGGTAWTPGPMDMDMGCGMTDATGVPCDMPCGDDDAPIAMCCDLEAPAPTDAVVPPATPRPDPVVAVVARFAVPPAPVAMAHADPARHGPPRAAVRRHLSLSVLLV
ncbi:hypothetical protein [Rubrivirga sp. IMCC43871]|uniref:hypothetical protein n=1 Tax=Rubrivirga sp. IMCC43871 TaxID=3391575 RepID=UPI00399007E0